MDHNLNEFDSLEIEPLSDEALEMVAGGKSSDGSCCCSCSGCSSGGPGPCPIVDPPPPGPGPVNA